MIIQEYNTSIVDNNFVQDFLQGIQERVEFIYSQFHVLEQIDFKEQKHQSN